MSCNLNALLNEVNESIVELATLVRQAERAMQLGIDPIDLEPTRIRLFKFRQWKKVIEQKRDDGEGKC